ncbi:MAG: hypothetical protein ABIW50_05745 [Candidatus Limnocylindria bacterium]
MARRAGPESSSRTLPSLVVGGALFGIGGAILAAPVVAAGRDLYRYGFHRLGGQVPAVSFDLTVHGSHPAPSGEPPGDASEPAATA